MSRVASDLVQSKDQFYYKEEKLRRGQQHGGEHLLIYPAELSWKVLSILIWTVPSILFWDVPRMLFWGIP